MIAAYFTRVGRVDTPAADNKAELGTLPRPADAPELTGRWIEKTFGELALHARFHRFPRKEAWDWVKIAANRGSLWDDGANWDDVFSPFDPDEIVFVYLFE